MKELDLFLQSLVPRNDEVITGTAAAGGGGLLAFLGVDAPVEALIFCMAVDYVSGILAAYACPTMTLDSRVGFRGICKKLLILCIVAATYKIGGITGFEIINTMAVWYFLANECLSIIENAANAGIPIPQKLIDTLEQVKKGEKIK